MNSAEICDLMFVEYGASDSRELKLASAPEPMMEDEERHFELTRRERKILGMADRFPLAVEFQEGIAEQWEMFRELIRSVLQIEIWRAEQYRYVPDRILNSRQKQALKNRGKTLSFYRRNFGNTLLPSCRPLNLRAWSR